MSSLRHIVDYANSYLSIQDYHDFCPNGLQVEGQSQVDHIVSAVSSSLELFQNAFFRYQAQLILVHHGLFWEKYSCLVGSLKNRIAFLLKYRISLLAYHLPLDSHPKIGNNVSIAQKLGLVNVQNLNSKIPLGVVGSLPSQTLFQTVLQSLKSLFSPNLLTFSFGLPWIKKIAIVSGRAPHFLDQAVQSRADLFITGEASESSLHLAKELKTHFVAVGHYCSEKFGVQNLGKLLAQKFNLNYSFIDLPNPV